MEKGDPEAREGVIQELFCFHRVVSTCQGNNLKCRACSSWVWWNGLMYNQPVLLSYKRKKILVSWLPLFHLPPPACHPRCSVTAPPPVAWTPRCSRRPPCCTSPWAPWPSCRRGRGASPGGRHTDRNRTCCILVVTCHCQCTEVARFKTGMPV